MELRTLLFRYNPWWEGEINFIKAYERKKLLSEMEKQFSNKNIIFITGLRRVGKTTLMKLFIKKLILEKGIKPDLIFYVSLDDFILDKYSISDIIEEFRKIHRHSVDKKIYVLLDEITYKREFHRQLKNLYDRENIKIYASSSSASILKDSSAFLTGRESIMEILPFFFEEYLELKGITINKRDTFIFEEYFEDYLVTGGLPEYIRTKDNSYINSLIDDILYKDIVLKNNIRDKDIIKDFFFLLMNHSSGVLSLYKISKVLKLSTETVSRYFGFFLNTYIIGSVKRCGKLNQRLNSPPKIYSADIGIRYIFSEGKKLGKQFENYFYLNFKKEKLCYLKEDSIEIDFLINNRYLVEVKYKEGLSPEQRKLFEKYEVEEKHIITNPDELNRLKDYCCK